MTNNIIKIGTVNLQNSKGNRIDEIDENGISRSSIISKHIEEEKFDILGTQELTRNFVNNITNGLTNYKLYGDYRYGNNILSKKISIIDDYNENNNIITNHKEIEETTIALPFIPNNIKELKNSILKCSIIPRIVTILLTKSDKGIICAINTHLDYQSTSVQKKQLHFLKNIVKKYASKFPVVLTGDFNMEVGVCYFDNFTDELYNLGVKRVDVNDKTNSYKYINETAIDHIFIPNDWEVINKGIKNIDSVTDHKEVFVEAIKRK